MRPISYHSALIFLFGPVGRCYVTSSNYVPRVIEDSNIYLTIFACPQVCALSARERVSESLALSYAEAPGRPLPDVIAQPGLSYDEVLHDDFRFDLNAHDVMVFLHIQKTGGTSFGKHLVMDLDLKVRIFLYAENC